MENKLYKSALDKKICGVCGGFAEFFGIDATLILLVVLFTLAGGSGILFYIVAALIMPDEPKYY